ncbi:SprT family protein [Fructilactobacillus frigidiflavus]|uniref:SprT family protein n=1 Tax=Fructilactobacillus frigidiflavus TaxID=3242688 RepID=UPI003757E92D
MTDQELQILVEKLSQTYFKRPFLHRAYFNRRLKTTGGRYHLKDHNIDINPKMADNPEVLSGIIKHELVHYHLHLNGHSGKHNTVSFKRLLQQVGGSRYAPRVDRNYKYEYQCTKCGQKYNRQRRIDTLRYVCSKCHGKLQLIQTN